MQHKQLKKILLVEDDEDIRAIAKLALEMSGDLQVLCCSSGVDAVRSASNLNVDLIIMDVMMPEMDGPEALSMLRQHEALRDTPCIFLTARTQKNEIKKYMNLSIISIISKPFDPMTLADEVRKAWDACQQ